MESKEPSRKRKLQEKERLQEEDRATDEQLVKRSKSLNPTASFFDVKRRRKNELEDSRRSPDHEPAYHRMSLDLELNLLPCNSATQHEKAHHSSHILFDLNQNHNHNQKIASKNVSELGLTRRDALWPTSEDQNQNQNSNNHDNQMNKIVNKDVSELGLTRRGSSWLASMDQQEEEEEEMVATVCKKCHMLVMLCKSSPACPNCKFMHSLEQSSQKPFTPSSTSSRLSLIC